MPSRHLHYKSSHPEHTKRSMICSQTLRLKRACSQESELKEHSSKLESWFLKRGYPEKIIGNKMKKGDKNRKVKNKTGKGYLS